jgi:hypothetical protein
MRISVHSARTDRFLWQVHTTDLVGPFGRIVDAVTGSKDSLTGVIYRTRLAPALLSRGPHRQPAHRRSVGSHA